MIISVHLASLGLVAMAKALLRSPVRARGLRWSMAAAPFAIGHVPPRPLRGVGLVAAWDDDAAADSFLRNQPWGEVLQDGFELRSTVVQSSGRWPDLPELDGVHDGAQPDGPVAVLTLGRLTTRRTSQLLDHPGPRLAVGLARPPYLSTFSVWDSPTGIQDHADVDSRSVRLRPRGYRGFWEGGDPLEGLTLLPDRQPADQTG
jgi:hypothetical protein